MGPARAKKSPLSESKVKHFTCINKKSTTAAVLTRRVKFADSDDSHDSQLEDDDIIPVTPNEKLRKNIRERLFERNSSPQDELDIIPPTPESALRKLASTGGRIPVASSDKYSTNSPTINYKMSSSNLLSGQATSFLTALSCKRKLTTNYGEEHSSIHRIDEPICDSAIMKPSPDIAGGTVKDLDDSSAKKIKLEDDCLSRFENDVDGKSTASLNLNNNGNSESKSCLNHKIVNPILENNEPFEDSLLDDLNAVDEIILKSIEDGAKQPEELANEVTMKDFGRHIVLKVCQKSSSEVELTLWSELLRVERICILKGFWVQTQVKPKDVVNVLGDFDSGNKIIVDDGRNFIIVHPDFLVSSTAVSSMVFCRRKTILSEWFRPENVMSRHMLIGTLVHQLFQEIALNRQRMSRAEVELRLKDILGRSSNLKELYKLKNELTEEQLWKELQDFIAPIDNWMQNHYTTKMLSTSNRCKPGSIRLNEIKDIEENVWCPRFGIKGKLDVTAKVQSQSLKESDSSDRETRVLPLELKTGRPTFSIEHQSQVMLYSMMLRDRYPDTHGGILLYLKNGEMKEVPSNIKSEQGLVQVRNVLVDHLVNPLRVDTTISPRDTNYRLTELPTPLVDSKLCSHCPQLHICSLLYQTRDPSEEKSSHSFESLSEKCLAQLSQIDQDYFAHWLHLLFMETLISRETAFQLENLWNSTARHREKRGDCFSDMQLVEIQEQSLRIKGHHQFCRRGEHWNSAQSLTSVGLTPSQSVVVSVEELKLLALSTGTIIEITDSFVKISLDRDLYSKPEFKAAKFRIDAYSSQAANVNCLSNLSRLMSASPNSVRLRRIVIQRQPPSFKTGLPKEIVIKGGFILKPLNKQQQRAILRVLQAEDYVLIKGMPGSGKTNTIVALIQMLVLFGHSVLLTSHTHSAVDNVLQKLKKKGVDFLRLGNTSRIHPSLKEHTEDHLLQDVRTLNDISRVYDTPQVVAITCLGSNHVIFSQRKEFDFCIVDEVSQILQPACLGPLFYCKRFVLVGDPKQLPPVIKSEEAKLLGMEECLFTRLTLPEATVQLTEQYRMNEEIQKFPNTLSYGGSLICANDVIAKSTLEVPNVTEVMATLATKTDDKWLEYVISSDLKKSVLFLNTDNLEALEAIDQHNKIYNEVECQLVLKLVTFLLQVGVKVDQLGVICPYRNQVAHIKGLLKDFGQQSEVHLTNGNSGLVEVNTVDQYQGRDKDVVIISLVRSSNLELPIGEKEILNDARRINVAITRAKKKLIIIGRKKTVCRYTPLKAFLELLTDEQEIILVPSCLQELPLRPERAL